MITPHLPPIASADLAQSATPVRTPIVNPLGDIRRTNAPASGDTRIGSDRDPHCRRRA
jgi:hypothetical protein